jgi:hypothetical protein
MLKKDSIKKDILKRYEFTDTGDVIIDVSAARVQDLYDDFDKTAPYMRKDLEEQLVHYLLDCTREIGNTKFVIHFNLDEPIDMESNLRVKESVKTYFSYLKELETRNMRDMLRKSFFLLGIGAIILILSLWIRNITATSENVFFQVIGEGLTVAAWVSLWEALATFLLQWTPTRKEIILCDRLSKAQVSFVYPSKP